MRSLSLKLHPESRCDAVDNIEVEITAERDMLLLRYLLSGRIADVRLPKPTVSGRADNLWKHTCFEAFARRPDEAGYREFNFAPSTQWAAYRFDDYRTGMGEADIAPPTIEIAADADACALCATIELLPADWRLALSAVIEETNGRKSYWALAHPPGKADFHHPDSFVLELTVPS